MEPTSYRHTTEYAISPEALYASLQKCVKGTLWKSSVASFHLNGSRRCLQLSRELMDGTYEPREPKRFRLTHPKPRSCCSIGIRDRVYQRSLNDNVVYPLMCRSLIKANCACQPGKGTDFARSMMKTYLRRHWHRHGTDGWVLQLDIKGYYPNMRHDVCKAAFRKKLPDDAYERVCAILDTQYAGYVGFDPGSQLIQIAGICVLDGLDHFVKERLRCKAYVRYMDDMVLIHHDREYLVDAKREIASYLHGLGYELNAKKTRLCRISERIPWLGFTFELKPSGKIVQRMRPEKVRQEKRKLRRMAYLVRDGTMSIEKLDECFSSWIGYAQRNCSDRATPEKMQRYYDRLRSEI